MNQCSYVFFSFSKWGDINRKDIQPEPEILPESLSLDHLFKVSMGSGDDPNRYVQEMGYNQLENSCQG